MKMMTGKTQNNANSATNVKPNVINPNKIWPAKPFEVIRIASEIQRKITVNNSKIVKNGHSQAANVAL